MSTFGSGGLRAQEFIRFVASEFRGRDSALQEFGKPCVISNPHAVPGQSILSVNVLSS